MKIYPCPHYEGYGCLLEGCITACFKLKRLAKKMSGFPVINNLESLNSDDSGKYKKVELIQTIDNVLERGE